MQKGLDVINKEINLETQILADKVLLKTATRRETSRLFEIIYPKLQHFIYKFSNNVDHTDEVLGNTIEKIFKNFHQYNNKWKFTTWIYNIAKNEALLFNHNQKKINVVDIDSVQYKITMADDSLEMLEKELCIKDLYSLTISAITLLPDGIEKEIIIDKDINQLKGKQISEKHGMNLNTVKTKLRKARKAVKDSIILSHPALAEAIQNYI